jgi:hypothetical protein
VRNTENVTSVNLAAPPFAPDSDFPTLPFVPPEVREHWTESEKFARHLLEIAAGRAIWEERRKAGQTITEAAYGLPVPYLNRRGYRRDRNGEWLPKFCSWDTAAEGRLAARETAALFGEVIA